MFSVHSLKHKGTGVNENGYHLVSHMHCVVLQEIFACMMQGQKSWWRQKSRMML